MSMELLPARMIEEYAYCPLVVYYRHVLKIPSKPTFLMHVGKELHEMLREKERRRKTLFKIRGIQPIRKWQSMYIASHKLGIEGVVDMIAQLDKRTYTVIEVKYTTAPRKTPSQYKYQLTAYVMLAEEAFKTTIRKAYIYYVKSNKLIEITITDHMKNHVKYIIKQIKRILSQEKIPKPAKTRKCHACDYYKQCKQIIPNL
ncbi:CRISPR-associated protein Cas4 [archaeon]|nr:MAG: CRISPR-associated protein Cas4 [archaeon]